VNEKKRRPVLISEALNGFLKRQGLDKRVAQASAIDDWPRAVGDKIATVTKPISITPDGTLFVSVLTHAWMTELSLLEPQLLAALNEGQARQRVRKIRFQLNR
jgi:predicted nucleic acid-binding Zn ribbon protein